MLNSPEATIKNFKKETIEAIVHKLNDLLKRSLTWDEREKTISELNLNIAIMCLKSQNLERRIHGIKVIDDIIKEMKYQSSFNTSNFSASQLIEWVRDNKVLDIVFNTKNNFHPQIVQRTNSIIEYLLIHKNFTEEDLNKIWDVSSQDEEIMKEVYKIIQYCSQLMPQEFIEKVLSKLNLSKQICPEEIDLLCGLGKAQKEST